MKARFTPFIVGLILVGLPLIPLCQNAGPNNAGTGANVSIGYNPSWAYPNNITVPGSPYAYVSISSSKCDYGSDYLRGTNYGFNIPSGATINGIQVTINRKGTQGCAGTGIQDMYVYLVKGVNGVPVIQTSGNNKASPAVWPTSLAEATYGSSTDLWNLSWTAGDINSLNFGVALAVQSNSYYDVTASVDYMQITVYYSLPSPPTITGIAPDNGCAGSGIPVIITGTNFTGATSVIFYNAQTASFTVNSSTQITATLPAGAATGAISVSTPSGTAASAGSFTVNDLPQGTLTANGPFCETGTGLLTFTASAGTGPFTVAYNDGTADRTQTNVTSGTTFETYANPVTATTTYTLVSVTGANTCARTTGFTGASATLTVDQQPTAFAGTDNEQCGLLSYTLEGNTPETGTGLWTGPTGVTFDDASKPNALASGLSPGDNLLTWTISNGLCNSSDNVLVHIYEGVSVSGSFTYFNPVPTKAINHVTIDLYKNGEFVESASTGSGNTFAFPNVCPGVYEVRATSSDPTGGINSTDAALINYWAVNSSSIQKVRFISGDVTGGLPQCQGTPDNNIIPLDAQKVHIYFVSGGTVPFDRASWSFWNTGETICSNPSPTCIQQYPTITVGNSSLTNIQFYGLCTGDFNQSFVPATEMKSTAPGLQLLHQGMISAPAGTDFELPVIAASPMEAGAVSLILDFPSDLVEVRNVAMNQEGGRLDWAVQGNELRIAWYSLNPVAVADGETLLTLTLLAKASFAGEEKIRFRMVPDPLNEIADGQFNPIPDAALGIADVGTGLIGINEPPEDEGFVVSAAPNPCQGSTELRYTLPFDGSVTIMLSSMTGALLYDVQEKAHQAGNHHLVLNTVSLEPGVYLIKVILKGQNDILVNNIKLVRSQ